MRAFACLSAFALVFATGTVSAQEWKASPQNKQTPAATEQKADEAAHERRQEFPGDAGTVTDARGGQGSPAPDHAVGPPNAGPVPVRGEGLDVPGASPQTAPAKYSIGNAKLAEGTLMGRPLQLSGEQKKAIQDAIGSRSETASTINETVHAEPGVFLPPPVQAEDLPATLNRQIPALRGMKYVRADDKILLVAPANGIIRSVIPEQAAP